MEIIGRDVKGQDIIFLVSGGIGDQIAFQPVIKYAIDKYLSEDTISVVSDYDWIWQDITKHVYTKDNPCPATNTSKIIDVYPINKPSSVDYQASHSTTFCSINLMRREIPLKFRQPNIEIKPEYFKNIPEDMPYDKLFVFHPGKTWDSRTISIEVWQSWIDKVSEMGYKTALIGKDMDVTIEGDNKVKKSAYSELKADYNFINKLKPLETCALLSKSFALVTNDSGPLHMAGCYDNFIFAFCSTRIPEYLFTWRGKEYSQYYKAAHLEKDELFYSVYDFNPFIQTGTDTAVGHPDQMKEVIPTVEEFEKIIRNTISTY